MSLGKKKESIDGQDLYSCIGRYINGSNAKLKIKPNAYSWTIKTKEQKKKNNNNNNNNDCYGIKRIAGRPFKAGQIEIYSSREINEGDWKAQHRVNKKRKEEEEKQQKKVRLPAQPEFKKLRFTRSDIV
jgi:hypothetical protein